MTKALRTSTTHPLKIDGFPLASGTVGMTLCPGRRGPSISGPDWDRDLAADVAPLFRKWGLDNFPVVDGRGRPVGVLDEKDLLEEGLV